MKVWPIEKLFLFTAILYFSPHFDTQLCGIIWNKDTISKSQNIYFFFWPRYRTFLSPVKGLIHSLHSCMWMPPVEHPFAHVQPAKGKQTALSLKSDTRQIALRRLPNWSPDFTSAALPPGKVPRKIRYTRAINSQLRNSRFNPHSHFHPHPHPRSHSHPHSHPHSQYQAHSHTHSRECKVQFNHSVVTGKNNMRKDASVYPCVACISGSKCTQIHTYIYTFVYTQQTSVMALLCEI